MKKKKKFPVACCQKLTMINRLKKNFDDKFPMKHKIREQYLYEITTTQKRKKRKKENCVQRESFSKIYNLFVNDEQNIIQKNII